MQVKLIYHKDKIDLNIKPTETVKDIREKLSYELGQLASNVHLKYNNIALEDDQILQNCITDKDVPVVIECDDDLSSDDEDEEAENGDPKTDHFELNPQSEFEIPSYTPPDFDEKVSGLRELTKQTKERCEQALRLAFFNADRAAEYLLSGEDLPERPTILPFSDGKSNHKFMPDRSQSKALQNFTDDEIATLQRIMDTTNTEFSMAVQYFVACEKKEEPTLEVLKSNK